ncbi:hypothetical protein P170DRAFT_427923 [Aspergillus steynii IBT 23096]|uniref:Uncharacterized protein n=1 Tax=Aspergillus steynii IBT 23096 TaxID=1392250 RepID=A0A2I2G154_9EURO|nr:uncharacterized protein P170DRAFT_427923 [Aspergillus steynii IBT 23096]PLB46617.1 hypothetical protein P170DRAFT_427923 [Aspergillus steynii IBT 23096]
MSHQALCVESSTSNSTADNRQAEHNAPGIGIEFETSVIQLQSQNRDCTHKDLKKAKGKLLGKRKGELWALTGDTTLEKPGTLTAEYILDRRKAKIGKGLAVKGANDASVDLVNWSPYANPLAYLSALSVDEPAVWHINPFYVVYPEAPKDVDTIKWSYQVTAPMPLRAINNLMRQGKRNMTSPLLPSLTRLTDRMNWVQRGFFRSRPEGIDPSDLSEDALGFFALVLSYAKASAYGAAEKSPKMDTSIMPRTDFVAMFQLTGLERLLENKSLYEIVRVGACYNAVDDDIVEIDFRWSDGDLDHPLPNKRFDELEFTFERHKLNVKEWIEAIQGRQDLLKGFDGKGDGQIGGLGDRTEWILGTTRPVPIFEFRDLGSCTRLEWGTTVDAAEQCVIQHHREAAQQGS